MTTDKDSAGARLVIAVTQFAPLQALWREALQHLRDPKTEVLALFVADDQWHRAASLPFTREISRFSGGAADFTLQRAGEVHEGAIAAARRRMQELAAEAKLRLHFEVLYESDEHRVVEVVAGPQNIVIAPSVIATKPLLVSLRKVGCRVVLIDAADATGNGR